MVILTPLESIQGIFTLLNVAISIILGASITLKYFKYKKRELLLVGITWMFLASPYWPDAINYLMIITTGNELSDALYLLLATVFLAPLHVIWIIAFTDFLYKSKQKVIVLIFLIESVIYEIVLISVFLIDYNLIGTKTGPFIASFADFISIYFIISILLIFFTGLLFAKESMKSQNKEIKLKGIFLMLAFSFFAVGGIIDIVFADSPSEITIVLARILVIIASFMFYIGFTLPKLIKKIFIKE